MRTEAMGVALDEQPIRFQPRPQEGVEVGGVGVRQSVEEVAVQFMYTAADQRIHRASPSARLSPRLISERGLEVIERGEQLGGLADCPVLPASSRWRTAFHRA